MNIIELLEALLPLRCIPPSSKFWVPITSRQRGFSLSRTWRKCKSRSHAVTGPFKPVLNCPHHIEFSTELKVNDVNDVHDWEKKVNRINDLRNLKVTHITDCHALFFQICRPAAYFNPSAGPDVKKKCEKCVTGKSA